MARKANFKDELEGRLFSLVQVHPNRVLIETENGEYYVIEPGIEGEYLSFYKLLEQELSSQ